MGTYSSAESAARTGGLCRAGGGKAPSQRSGYLSKSSQQSSKHPLSLYPATTIVIRKNRDRLFLDGPLGKTGWCDGALSNLIFQLSDKGEL